MIVTDDSNVINNIFAEFLVCVRSCSDYCGSFHLIL